MRWLAHRGGALDFRDHAQAFAGHAVPDRGRARRRSGDDPGRGHAGARHAVRIPVRRTAARRAHRDRQVPLARPAGAGVRRDRARRLHPARRERPDRVRDRRRRSVRRPHRLLQRGRALSRCSRIERITMRRDPIYHSTYTGKPPDEPSMLGVALNEVFVPLLQKQFPEIADFYLPPEGCSYRMAVVALKKQYPGHAKRVMFGVWSFLRQFMYTKFIVVTDDDIDVRDWKEVIWAITTRVDPARDTLIVPQTPIDYLDFASPVAGLGSKMGIDATNKWPGETQRAVGPADRDGRGRQGARRRAVEGPRTVGAQLTLRDSPVARDAQRQRAPTTRRAASARGATCRAIGAAQSDDASPQRRSHRPARAGRSGRGDRPCGRRGPRAVTLRAIELRACARAAPCGPRSRRRASRFTCAVSASPASHSRSRSSSASVAANGVGIGLRGARRSARARARRPAGKRASRRRAPSSR